MFQLAAAGGYHERDRVGCCRAHADLESGHCEAGSVGAQLCMSALQTASIGRAVASAKSGLDACTLQAGEIEAQWMVLRPPAR